jgi:hypothetical protein
MLYISQCGFVQEQILCLVIKTLLYLWVSLVRSKCIPFTKQCGIVSPMIMHQNAIHIALQILQTAIMSWFS